MQGNKNESGQEQQITERNPQAFGCDNEQMLVTEPPFALFKSTESQPWKSQQVTKSYRKYHIIFWKQ